MLIEVIKVDEEEAKWFFLGDSDDKMEEFKDK